jgi:class 3 adenylate cyclase
MDKRIVNIVQCEALYLFCDIRGFSNWMKDNQYEAHILLELYYSTAFTCFGEMKDQKYHERVAKLLGDGFFVVYEYEENNNTMLTGKVSGLIRAINIFSRDFYGKLGDSTLHGKRDIKCSFGLSYGPCMRFHIPGYPLDYVSHKINYASRLVSAALSDEVVFEHDLWDYIHEDDVSKKRKDNRDLKKMGTHEVGVFTCMPFSHA